MGIEKYLSLVALVAPGFISTYISSVLGTAESKRNELNLIMRYFLHSFFAIIGALCIMWCAGYINLDSTWKEIWEDNSTVKFSVLFLLAMLTSSIATGLIWSLWIGDLVLRLLNAINQKRNRNIRFTDGSLMHRLFVADGKDHFIIVYKDGVDEPLAIGFYYASSDPKDDRIELNVTTYPEYKKEYVKMLSTTEESPLRNTISTYVDFSNGIVIVETEYYDEWTNYR